MGDSSVKVAVRVRPFNKREETEGAVLCIDMQGKMTRVITPEGNRDYFFDYSYWSHNEFVEDPESGMMVKDSASSKYADQRLVYEDLGVGVLNNAFEGYHCCLFAYGQTGSGKSYSMVGYGKNKGIIPIVCEEIFKRIDRVESNTLHCEVTASMLEIYNEQVQDLLKPPGDRVKGGLKVREDPKTGVYVEGLSKTSCSSYEDISAVLDKGNNNRTVAATQMNATSSRAHTVLTIYFTQIMYNDAGQPQNRKQSNINLVDLAGSERASKTGASGDTLKEGSNINKSLSTLGRVISSLAKRSSGSKDVVPYRESSLTRILQNALGGNSKTTMIAAISPATYNIEETISTLVYANQVKSIKNQAIVNETPQEKLIRELKVENEKLKAMLEGKVLPGGGGGGGIDEDMRRQFEKQIEELKRAKEEAEMTFQNRPREAPRVHGLNADTSKLKLNTPHISNLNEDPLLSGYISHTFKQGKNRIGKKNPASPPDIVIEGLGIGTDHCVLECQGDQYTLYPSLDPNLKTMLNGKPLLMPTVLENQNRIRFGNHNYFLYVDPEELSSSNFDWEFAVKEANEEQVRGLLGHQDEELKAKEAELKKKMEAEFEVSRRKMEEEKKALELLMSSKNKNDLATQKALADREQELIAKQRAMEEEIRRKEQILKQNEENRLALERLKQVLSHSIQQINEANERAVLLGKHVTYQPELYIEGGGIRKGLQSTNVRVKVSYPDISDDIQIFWDLDQLDRRLIDMQEICNQIELGSELEDVVGDYDPFMENVDSISKAFHLIGHSYLYLDTLYYLASLEEDTMAIINDHGNNKGALKVSIVPTIDGIDLEEYETLKELIGRELSFCIKINEAIGIPENYSTNVFCKYHLSAKNNEEFKTSEIKETTTNPKFNYSQTHKLPITAELNEEFLNKALTISVFGDITEAKKVRELEKLKESINKSTTMKLSVMKNARDMDGSNNLGDDIGPSIILQGIDNDTSYLRSELDAKEQQLQKIKAEQLKREAEYTKRIKELEEREKKIGIVPPQRNGSSCCVTF